MSETKSRYLPKVTIVNCYGRDAHLKANDVGTEERSKLSIATLSTAFIAHLIIENVWLYFDTFVNITVL
jgi:hypothetical protein